MQTSGSVVTLSSLRITGLYRQTLITVTVRHKFNTSEMEKLRAKHLYSELCNIYHRGIGILSMYMETLQLENQELKHHYKALISAKRKEQEALLPEKEELKKELHRVEAMNANEMSREEMACPFKVEELLQQLGEEKMKPSAERC